MKLQIIYFLLFFCCVFSLNAQDSRLAQQYYQNGEYEKAASLYTKLFEENKNNDFYFSKYIDCLIYMEDYAAAEEAVKKQIKKTPKSVQLYVTYGNIYERQFMDDKANDKYKQAIDQLPSDRFAVTKLANAFIALTKYELATETYEKGAKLLKDKNIFAYNLGDLYRRKGDVNLMIESYLNSLNDNPGRLNTMKTMFQRNLLTEEDYDELQTQLYTYIQENDEAVHFSELLAWVFIQRKDYNSALRQVKALDRRLDENGGRVFKIAEIANNAKDYETAVAAYDYIITEKGKISTFYLDSKRELLGCKRKQIVEGFEYTQEDLRVLEQQYNTFLDEFGRNKSTATIVAELANLEAFYLNDIDKAIGLLKEMIGYNGMNRHVLARAKLSLADFYLIKGEKWEATLLYSQVDKEFKDDILGHEARYRNAKLSYYTADFEWAQAQFDVLKASTSKLISNDAIDLSVFIMDEMGLDTTSVPLETYAKADLLVFQNKFDEAFEKLDSLNTAFPNHTLEDDIYYMKSQVYFQQREYKKSEEMLEKIVEKYPDGIRADNALFKIAELNEYHLNNIEKAKSLYEKLFLEYSGSTLAVDARKKFRKLRGDDMQ